MFKVTNLKKYVKEGWAYLSCDFQVQDADVPFSERTMWIAVEEKNSDMLSDEVYDPFVLVPVYLGMHYGQDVHIEGNISPKLYHNMKHYLMNIFDRFSDYTKQVKFTVDGVKTIKRIGGGLIGTGISCGVDSLTTIYDNFICEDDPEFKINSLFFVNSGTHGHFENKNSRKLFFERAALNKRAADELGLPMYLIDSNFHAYTHTIGEQRIGYLAIYSCILGLQKYIKRYYTSSNLSYDEILQFWKQSRDLDIAEYSESFMPHLISTENFELVIDGCQYTRPEKTERISDWGIAQKYLSVCISEQDNGYNCSRCEKCMWTLIPLEAMGKIHLFGQVFDLEKYYKNAWKKKWKFLANSGKDAVETSVASYVKKKGMRLPPKFFAVLVVKAGKLFKYLFKR